MLLDTAHQSLYNMIDFIRKKSFKYFSFQVTDLSISKYGRVWLKSLIFLNVGLIFHLNS